MGEPHGAGGNPERGREHHWRRGVRGRCCRLSCPSALSLNWWACHISHGMLACQDHARAEEVPNLFTCHVSFVLLWSGTWKRGVGEFKHGLSVRKRGNRSSV